MVAPYTITKPHKSIGIALILTLLFGPIGLLYASVFGGLVMMSAPVILFFLLYTGALEYPLTIINDPALVFIVLILAYWIINITWAIDGVINYNRRIDREAKKQMDLLTSLLERDNKQIIVNFTQKSADTPNPQLGKSENKIAPNIQDWLKNNPGRTINEYFTEFGR